MSSILTDVKHKIGPSADYEYFDLDILDSINTAFAILNQLGVGTDGFTIDENTEWTDFVTDALLLNLVKQYIYKKALILFDPPQNSSLLSQINNQIAELEFRLNVWVDPEEDDDE